MINNIYILTSRVQAQKSRMDTVADNAANVDTAGFKKLANDYQEVSTTKQGQSTGSFTNKIATRVDYTSGTINHTGNPFDLALVGKGFFGVERDGQTVYTRAGQFNLDAEGNLVNGIGEPVLDANNAPIAIPADAGNVFINKDGFISADGQLLGSVGIFKFAEEDMPKLLRDGNGGFVANGAVPEVPEVGEVKVLQGSIESSNVNSVEEMTKMVEISRAYQSSLNLIQKMEDLDIRGIRQLSAMPQ